MKCYVCAKQGVDKDAVAICIVCGMGLCMGHAFKEELLVKDIIDWGFGEEQITYPHTLPRFICAECKLAIEQRKRWRGDNNPNPDLENKTLFPACLCEHLKGAWQSH